MKNKNVLLPLCLCAILCGCVAPNDTRRPVRSWRLQPTLSQSTALQIYVEDCRPVVERERVPSTDYFYTGFFGAVDENARTISSDLTELVKRFGGASTYQLLTNVPTNGRAIILRLDHWYARAERNPKKALIVIQGEFAGTMTLQWDSQVLAAKQIQAAGTPTVVDRTRFPWETDKTPDMVAKGMRNTANSGQQKAYYQVMDFLQDAWPLLSK